MEFRAALQPIRPGPARPGPHTTVRGPTVHDTALGAASGPFILRRGYTPGEPSTKGGAAP